MNFGANLDDSNARLHRFPDFGPRLGSLGELIAWKILLDCPQSFFKRKFMEFPRYIFAINSQLPIVLEQFEMVKMRNGFSPSAWSHLPGERDLWATNDRFSEERFVFKK